MRKIWIFDIDGTLCESRKPMSDEVVGLLTKIILSGSANMIVLNSGSTWESVCAQVPKGVRVGVAGIFPCLGNELYIEDDRIYTTPIPVLTTEMLNFFHTEWFRSGCKTFGMFKYDERPGMINIPMTGSLTDDVSRQSYANYDAHHHERREIVRKFNTYYPMMRASIGGKVSIDVSYPGQDKSQIYRVISPLAYLHKAEICVVGDRMDDDGNDRPLISAIDQHKFTRSVFPVRNVADTVEILKAIQEEQI